MKKILLLCLFIFAAHSQEKTDEEFLKWILEEVQKEWVIYVKDYSKEKNINPEIFPKKLPNRLVRVIRNIPTKELRTYAKFAKDDPKKNEHLSNMFKGYLDTQYAVEKGKAPEFYADKGPPIVISKKGARPLGTFKPNKPDSKIDEVPWWKEYMLYLLFGGVFLLIIIWDKIRKKES
jgi:hypothetical protein